MNPRLTIAAAIAVAAASLSLNAVISSNAWLFAGLGAIICVALVGSLTRVAGIRATVGVSLLVLIAIMPLFTGHGWWPRVAGLLIVAIAATSLAAGRLRWLTSLAAYLAVLVIYFNLVFAGDKSFARVIPTGRSLAALAALPSQAVKEFGYRPPVPDIAAVSFFAAAGIGLVAVLVDILAVWFRRPALAGLPLLALFSVPVASNLAGFGIGQSLIFAIGLVGFLVLLASDGRQRLRMWGRLVSFRYVQPADEAGPGPDTRDIAASGRRIGLAAVCLAIVVPLVLPTMHVHDVFATSGDGNGPGNGPGSGGGPPSPLLKVQGDLLQSKHQKVLTYHTNSPDPKRQYLQVYALTYNRRNDDWVPLTQRAARNSEFAVAVSPKLPERIPGLNSAVVPSENITTSVTMASDQTGLAVLAMPYAPVKLSTAGVAWLEQPQSLTVSSDTVDMSDLHYKVTSTEAEPTKAELEAEMQLPVPRRIRDTYTTYHGPDVRQLRRIADRIVSQAHAHTNYAKADALELWFKENFLYDLKPGLPNSPNWIYDFLTSNRHGFCQQFAWAFAVLGRLLSIPTRIAVGYTAGSLTGHGTSWTGTVTTADAHAWPEIYVTNVGWVRFEPTPSGIGGQGTATAPSYAPAPALPNGVLPGIGGAKGASQSANGSSGKTSASCPGGLENGACAGRNTRLSGAGTSTKGGRSGPGFPWGIVVPVIIVVLLVWPGLGRIATRRRRWLVASGNAGLAHAAWREMVDDLADYGFARQLSESPRALARRIATDADLQGSAREAVRRIGSAEERARYALSAAPGEAGLRADVRIVRRAVAAHSSPTQRLRARLFPASTLTAALHGLQRITEVFGWLDTSWPSMRQVRRSMATRSSAESG